MGHSDGRQAEATILFMTLMRRVTHRIAQHTAPMCMIQTCIRQGRGRRCPAATFGLTLMGIRRGRMQASGWGSLGRRMRTLAGSGLGCVYLGCCVGAYDMDELQFMSTLQYLVSNGMLLGEIIRTWRGLMLEWAIARCGSWRGPTVYFPCCSL